VSAIALLTDFGHSDPFVGVMKGVIASIAPTASVIDLCHDVPPQSTRRAGLALEAALPFFPPRTIFVVVVDPGVGSHRRILALSTRYGVVLAPDNGLVGVALAKRSILAVHEVRRPDLYLEPLSQTFHGRDVFSPIAAHLANGLAVDELGPIVTDYERDQLPTARRSKRQGRRVLTGEVIDVDRFGNLLTNVRPRARETLVDFEIGGGRVRSLSESYSAVEEGQLLAVVSSTGRVELALRNGSAKDALSADVGSRVSCVVVES